MLDAFRKMLLLMDVESPREPGGGQLLSFRVAAAVDFGAPLKQELLESRSEARRLETLLGSTFAEKAPAAVVDKERQKLASYLETAEKLKGQLADLG